MTVPNSERVAASFTSPAAGATVDSTVSVGLAASGGTAPYTYRLTSTAHRCSRPHELDVRRLSWNTTTVTNGSHSLGLTVTDPPAARPPPRGRDRGEHERDLRVSLTTPSPGATVSGTVWVNVWVDGAAAGTKAYTMTVGSATVWTESSANTHVTLPWATTSTPTASRRSS